MIWATTQVALGGAIGAALRYWAVTGMLNLTGAGFPLGVLAVNILGSFVMGAFMVISTKMGLAHLNPLIMAGLLGGFTTFSAFSLEAYALFERGAVAQAALYVGLSVGVSIAALVAGVMLARGVLA